MVASHVHGAWPPGGSPRKEETLASLIAQAPQSSQSPHAVPATRPRRIGCWRQRVPDLLAVAICLAALAGAAWVSTTVFDRLPHTEDEVAYLFQARTIAAGQLVARAPAYPEFFEIPFVMIHRGWWMGKYLPGYPAALALGVLAGQPWLLNPVVGALSVGLVYLAGRRLYGAPTGLLAAALTAASPFFLLQAGSFMSHVVCLCWALAFLLLFERARQADGLSALGMGGLAGVTLGMLFLARPLTAVAVGLPYALWAGVEIVRWPRRLPVYLVMLLLSAYAVIGMFAYNRLTTGDPLLSAYEVYWPFDRVGFGEGIGTNGRHTLQDGRLNTELHLKSLKGYLFGWPWQLSLVPAALGAAFAAARLAWHGGRWLVGALRRAKRGRGGQEVGATGARDLGACPPPEAWDLLHVGVVVSLVLAHAAYWYGQQVYGPRYYFEALGALTLLSARGLLQLAELAAWPLRWVARGRWRPRVWTTTAVLLAVGVLTLHSFGNFAPREFRLFTGWYNVRDDDLRRVRAAGLEHAVVFIARDNWTQYAPFFSEFAPRLDADVVYAADLGDERNRDLMALYPGRAFYRYADRRLTPLAPP